MIHDVVRKGGVGVILELMIRGFSEQIDLSEEETEGIEPGK